MPKTSGLGKKGEERAAEVLEAAGMEIIGKNYRSKAGEIDIIALDGETIVFVEVKTWSIFGMEDLQYSLNNRKKQKIIKTANFFLLENRKYSNMAIRFDVIFVKNNKVSEGFKESEGFQESERFHFTHLASAFTESV
jgi:putative endonuclease